MKLQFENVYLYDGEGDDLYVFEIGGDHEHVDVAVSEDGIEWTELGLTDCYYFNGGVDLHGRKELEGKYIKYVKIIDLGECPNSDTPGADIDAVCALNYTYTNPADYPEGTVTWGGHKYCVFDEYCTWEEAKTNCEDLDGHLLTITSAAEQAFVESLLASHSRYEYFIGGTDAESEGDWQWVTGERWGYTNWAI